MSVSHAAFMGELNTHIILGEAREGELPVMQLPQAAVSRRAAK